ncbi:MAG: prefoldin subunit beta [Nanoarchaeota archaeon]|nr:prefoldin subunit beta [Nanoarchaeota archaeon]
MASTKINQLQLLQQNLQNIAAQKQQYENQLIELDSALTELLTTDKAYKIVGKLMFASSTEKLKKELEEKKEVAQLRLNNFTKQEDKLKQSLEEAQQEVMGEFQRKK